ncbi:MULTISPECIES: acylneuraminate cytidylyltransferase family protein [Helicobacter]|uniref:acylneuraminate cytidylyltransferase family protein n=1 Tax=Helicobacter TaxID=209 RepID=UPI00261997FB|nr:acylneuraminate cytidylyltransferase family protein [Helicobacter sp. UBA3407]
MTLAIIPARAGSKGIKNKNLTLLDGKPLLYYTIQAAKKAKCIDEIVLSSDGEEILEYGKSQGIQTLKRPSSLSQDDTTSDKVILHTLEFYPQYQNIILLQPTSPFRTTRHIEESFERFKKRNANALISVIAIDNKILKAFILDNQDNLKGICNDFFPFMPRQSLPTCFMSNGAIYIVKSETFRINPTFLPLNTDYYLMDKQSSLDIDCIDDLINAEQIIKGDIKCYNR